MELNELSARARKIKEKYEAKNLAAGQEVWDANAYMQGFVGDVGDLTKLIMAKANYRTVENLEQKLGHELADCLWSLLVLADELQIDLEQSFLATMVELENRIK